jgi:hypothetical protein
MNQNIFCSKCHRIPSQCCCSSAKELTEEEITECLNESMDIKDLWGQPLMELNPINFARAILKKASEG